MVFGGGVLGMERREREGVRIGVEQGELLADVLVVVLTW